MVEAIENAVENQTQNFDHVSRLRERFLKGIGDTNLDFAIHSNIDCSPYIVSISFMGCRAETILNKLSDKGVFIGNGSA